MKIKNRIIIFLCFCFLFGGDIDRELKIAGKNKNQIKIINFEELVSDPKKQVDNISKFLNLKTLNLKSNNITELGAKSIANSPKLKKLEHLILKFNRIGEMGANYLAQSETLTNLSTLDLFRNRIGDTGTKIIKKSNLRNIFNVIRRSICNNEVKFVKRFFNIFIIHIYFSCIKIY